MFLDLNVWIFRTWDKSNFAASPRTKQRQKSCLCQLQLLGKKIILVSVRLRDTCVTTTAIWIPAPRSTPGSIRPISIFFKCSNKEHLRISNNIDWGVSWVNCLSGFDHDPGSPSNIIIPGTDLTHPDPNFPLSENSIYH